MHSRDATFHTDLDCSQVIIKRRWASTILETILSPISFIWAGYNWATESIERRIGRWRLKGEDERVSKSEMMTGEIATMIGVIAGALAGVCVAKLSDPQIGSFSELYFWYILFFVILFGIPLFYKWMRSQIWNSRRSAWEPYVPASAAKRTLLHEWQSHPVKVKWKATAICALANEEFDAFLTALDRVFLASRLIIGGAYTAAAMLLFQNEYLGGALAIACVLGTCLGIVFSLARDYCSVTARSHRFHARLSVLNKRLESSDAEELDENILEEIDSLISRLEKLKS